MAKSQYLFLGSANFNMMVENLYKQVIKSALDIKIPSLVPGKGVEHVLINYCDRTDKIRGYLHIWL